MKRRWELCPKIGSAHSVYSLPFSRKRWSWRKNEGKSAREIAHKWRVHRFENAHAHYIIECAPCAYNYVFKASHIGWIWFVHWTFHHHSILFSCPFSRNGKSVQDHMHAPYCEYRVHAFNFRFLFALFFLRSFSAWFIRISRAQRIQSCSISLELIREKLKMDSKLLKLERTGEKRKHTFEHT